MSSQDLYALQFAVGGYQTVVGAFEYELDDGKIELDEEDDFFNSSERAVEVMGEPGSASGFKVIVEEKEDYGAVERKTYEATGGEFTIGEAKYYLFRRVQESYFYGDSNANKFFGDRRREDRCDGKEGEDFFDPRGITGYTKGVRYESFDAGDDSDKDIVKIGASKCVYDDANSGKLDTFVALRNFDEFDRMLLKSSAVRRYSFKLLEVAGNTRLEAKFQAAGLNSEDFEFVLVSGKDRRDIFAAIDWTGASNPVASRLF